MWLFNQPHGPVPNTHPIGYIIIGAENWNTPGKTFHLQVYLEFESSKVRYNQMNSWFRRSHCEPRYGTPEEARDYCKKEGKWRERGTISSSRMTANGSDGLATYWSKILDQIQGHAHWRDVILDHELAAVTSRCMAWAKEVFNARPVQIPAINIRADGYRYQARFDLFLRKIPPDDRTVVACVDLDGNIGKTKFCKHAMVNLGALIGKAENFQATGYLYTGQPICLFDVARANSTRVDWELIEKLKDGMLVNTKYECNVKTAVSPTGTSHVFLFMNAYPDLSKLSLDRWHLIDNFGDDQTIHDLFPPARFPGVADLIDPFDNTFVDSALMAPEVAPEHPPRRRRLLIVAPAVAAIAVPVLPAPLAAPVLSIIDDPEPEPPPIADPGVVVIDE